MYGMGRRIIYVPTRVFSDSKVHGVNMGPTWVLSVPDGPHVGPMNLAIWVILVLVSKVAKKLGEYTPKQHSNSKIYIILFLIRNKELIPDDKEMMLTCWYDVPSLCLLSASDVTIYCWWQHNPDSKLHGANKGAIWGRQDPGGPRVCPMNFAIWENVLREHGKMDI